MSEFVTCEVLAVEQLSPVVRNYRVQYPFSHSFLPGQFVMLDLPIEGEFSTRSYSIASAPNAEGYIDLCIVLKEDGQGSPYLFREIEAGSKLKVSEPQGKFVLADELKGLVLISTGTGVAPFRAMIQQLLIEHNALPFPVYLIFGNRYERDILYRSEWQELEQKEANFHFVPVLSRDENWAGAKGYVHEHYLPIAQHHAEFHYYLCGWSTMVREAKNKLKELGFSRKQLKFELYD